jgi:phage-related baseplate assembly protein
MVIEDDNRLRYRCLLAWEGLAATGTTFAYTHHVFNFDPRVANVSVYFPRPGVVRIIPLLSTGDGIPDRAFLRRLRNYIKQDNIKNLTDKIQVRPPRVMLFRIRAELVLYPGAGNNIVYANATRALEYFLNTNYKIGRDINRASIMAALHQSGVANVRLAEPQANIVVRENQLARCEDYQVNISIYETD